MLKITAAIVGAFWTIYLVPYVFIDSPHFGGTWLLLAFFPPILALLAITLAPISHRSERWTVFSAKAVTLVLTAATSISLSAIVAPLFGAAGRALNKQDLPGTLVYLLIQLAITIGLFIAMVMGPVTIEIPTGFGGLLTYQGLRQENREAVLREGKHPLLSLGNWFFNFNVHETRIKDEDFMQAPETWLVTPDGGQVRVRVSIHYQAFDLFTYDQNGGENGVMDRMDETIESCLRRLSRSENEGPLDFREALSMGDDAAYSVVRSLLDKDTLPKIEMVDVRTVTLMRFFNDPQLPPTKIEEERWDKDWKGLLTYLQGNLSPEELQELREEVAKRQEILAKLRQSKGNYPITRWGIKLVGVVIGEVQLEPKLAEAMSRNVQEKELQQAANVDAQRLGQLIREIRTNAKEVNISDEMIQRIALAFMGKADMKVFDIPGLPRILERLRR